jgi:murein DD-endopeptidase MepM/ murein hydrolase activator NlpD
MAYTVQSGDSLYKIARENGITYQELIRLNPQYADNPNLIRPGQTVNLPQTGETTDDIDPAFSREPNFRDDIPNNTDYPAHWGEPPMAQTKDLRVLPGGYGQGSGTLATWIADNMRKDNPDITMEELYPGGMLGPGVGGPSLGNTLEPVGVMADGVEGQEPRPDPFENVTTREELLGDPAYATFMAAFGMDKANINRTMKMNYERLLQQATRNFGLYQGSEDASERNQLMSGSRSGGLYDIEFDKAKNVAVNQAAGRGMAFSGQTASTVGDLAEERLLAESDFQRDLLNAYNIAEQEKQVAADKLIKDKLEQERESYETLGIFQAGG